MLGISGKYNLKQQTMSYAASAGMPVRTITVTAGAEEERGRPNISISSHAFLLCLSILRIHPSMPVMADQNREYRYNYNEDILT